MAAHAAIGAKALETKDYPLAISSYTKAIAEFPTSPNYYIQRSTAYQRANEDDAALKDAEKAVLLSTQRAKRELIATSQFRRGQILYKLQRFGDAGFCFEVVKKLNEKEKGLAMWEAMYKAAVGKLEKDDPKLKVTIKEKPDAVEEPAKVDQGK